MRMRTVVGVLCLIGVVGALVSPAMAGVLKGTVGDGRPDLYLGVKPADSSADEIAAGVWLSTDGAMYDDQGTMRDVYLDSFDLLSKGQKIWAYDPYYDPLVGADEPTTLLPGSNFLTYVAPEEIFWSTASPAPKYVGKPTRGTGTWFFGPALDATWAGKLKDPTAVSQILADLTVSTTAKYFVTGAGYSSIPTNVPIDVIFPEGVVEPHDPEIGVIGGLIADVTGPEGWMKDFTWDLSQYYSDADGDTATQWSLVGETHGARLDAATGILQWQPNYNWDHVGAPPAMFGVQVTDSSGATSAVRDFDITVVPEPGTIVMLLSGALLGLALWRRRHS